MVNGFESTKNENEINNLRWKKTVHTILIYLFIYLHEME